MNAKTKPVLTLRVGRYEVSAPYVQVTLELPTGNEPGLTSEEWGRLELQAAIAVLSSAPSIMGAELKFARKAMGLTQPELAALLDVAVETVCRWEKGAQAETVSKTTQLAVLHLLEHTRDTGSPSAAVPPQGVVLRLAS